MLATRDDKCLLDRQKMWPAGFYSALAGFVEPGETVEEACVRELYEEAGIVARADRVRYLFAQPWPFPSSLMFGLHVPAESAEIKIDPSELETARWFTRAEAMAMREGGLDTPDGKVFPPSMLAIARRILDAWLDGA
jgi:NAD+ diphosphatase